MCVGDFFSLFVVLVNMPTLLCIHNDMGIFKIWIWARETISKTCYMLVLTNVLLILVSWYSSCSDPRRGGGGDDGGGDTATGGVCTGTSYPGGGPAALYPSCPVWYGSCLFKY